MIRQKRISPTIEISNPNFMLNMDEVLKNEINLYTNKTLANYIILDTKLLHKGPAKPVSAHRTVICTVTVMLEFTILLAPDHTLLEKCAFIEKIVDEVNQDQFYYQFSLVSDDIPQDLLNRIVIFVGSNGLKADTIRKLNDLEPGDIIPLFVISSTVHRHTSLLVCPATPDITDITVVFKFSQKMIDTGKFDQFSKVKISADKFYRIKDKKLYEVNKSNASSVVDFLSVDQLVDYISMLVSL